MTTSTDDKPWKVVHDGPSYGMLESPTGRIFGLQELVGGQWRTPTDNEALCAFFIEVIAHRPPKVPTAEEARQLPARNELERESGRRGEPSAPSASDALVTDADISSLLDWLEGRSNGGRSLTRAEAAQAIRSLRNKALEEARAACEGKRYGIDCFAAIGLLKGTTPPTEKAPHGLKCAP